MAMETDSGSAVSLVDAIEEKYADGADDNDSFTVQIFVPKSAPGQKDTGEIVVPTELSLNKRGICCAGDANKVQDLCSSVTYLDLSENKLEEWQEVFNILEGVPLCSFLDLRKNPLSQQIKSTEQKQYPHLVKLVLNDLKLPWIVIEELLSIFPKLYELHLSLNEYSSVELLEDQSYPGIQILHFNGNKIENWNEVSKLGKAFPNLDLITLLENPLQTLPSPEEMIKNFSQLKTLSVSKTNIPNWEELEKFKHFPNLTHIRLQGLDFVEQYKEDLRRQLILAYLPNISRLNGGRVYEEERETAERAMIRHYMDKAELMPQRYHELEAKHGKLEPLVELNLSSIKTFSVVVDYNGKTFLQTIQDNWTREEFKEAIRAKVDNMLLKNMTVYHVDGQHTDGYNWKLPHPWRTMRSYSVNEGDTFLIQEEIRKVFGPGSKKRPFLKKKAPTKIVKRKEDSGEIHKEAEASHDKLEQIKTSSKRKESDCKIAEEAEVYHEMIGKGVPLKAVCSKMIAEGLDPALLNDMCDSDATSNSTESPAKKNGL